MSKLLVKLIDASSVLTPGQNQVTIFMDSSDSLLKGKFDDGSVVPLGSSTSLNVLTTVVPTIVPENAAAQDGNTIQVIINRLQGQIDNISISPADVLGVVLTTFSASNTAIQSGDTVLEALQNSQGQINAINSQLGNIGSDITDLQTADGSLQTQIDNITNNFSTNVLATTLGAVTPANLAIATGNTIAVAFDRTQGQINAIISGFATNVMSTSIGTVTPVNTALANNVTLSVAMNRLQGQIDAINTNFTLGTITPANTALASGITIATAWNRTQGQIDAINTNFTLGTITPVNTALASGISIATAWNRIQGQINAINSSFSTNVLATTLGTVTPTNLAIATGNTISVAFDRTQGQINAINANFTLGTITPANTALASGISIATAWNRVQGQINAINTSIAGTINRIPYYDSASSFGDSNLAVSGTDVSFVADGRIHRTSGGTSNSLYFSVGVSTSVITDGTNSCTIQATTSAYVLSLSGASGSASRFSTSVGGGFVLASPISGAKITLSTTTVEIRRASTEGDGLLSFNFITGETNNAFEIGNDDCLNAHLKIVDGDWFGVATLASGEVNISNAACDGNKRIYVTPQDNSTKGALRVVKSTGSFIIRSSDNTDNGEVAWWMIDAKPK